LLEIQGSKNRQDEELIKLLKTFALKEKGGKRA
jgi:hypothetical protein